MLRIRLETTNQMIAVRAFVENVRDAGISREVTGAYFNAMVEWIGENAAAAA